MPSTTDRFLSFATIIYTYNRTIQCVYAFFVYFNISVQKKVLQKSE